MTPRNDDAAEDFLKKQKAFADAYKEGVRKGELPPAVIVEVLHDSWCDRLNQRGPCNCTPEVVAPKPILDAEQN